MGLYLGSVIFMALKWYILTWGSSWNFLVSTTCVTEGEWSYRWQRWTVGCPGLWRWHQRKSVRSQVKATIPDPGAPEMTSKKVQNGERRIPGDRSVPLTDISDNAWWNVLTSFPGHPDPGSPPRPRIWQTLFWCHLRKPRHPSPPPATPPPHLQSRKLHLNLVID